MSEYTGISNWAQEHENSVQLADLLQAHITMPCIIWYVRWKLNWWSEQIHLINKFKFNFNCKCGRKVIE